MRRSVRVRDLQPGDVIVRDADRLGDAVMCIVSYVGPVARSTGGWHAIVHSMAGETSTIWAEYNEGYVGSHEVFVELLSRVATYQQDGGVRGG